MAEKMPRILIVDDDPLNIKVLNAMLKAEYEIVVALSGDEALQRVATNPRLDVILLDIRMPEMDGFQVCERLKANPETKDTPVIFVTSLDNEEEEQKGLELGAADYIIKPFRSAVVRARVRNHVKLKRSQDLLKRLSNLDGLTGIPNRRRFDEVLSHEWRRGIRKRSPLSLIMLDIDHFKPFNDHYGHAAGDECLRKVARMLELSLGRSVDFVGRYGGEEFACILPDTDLNGAVRVAENLRGTIRNLAIPHAFSDVTEHVTVSLGAAATIPNAEITLDRLIETADTMLYKAKKDGRNCVKSKEMV